MGEPRGGCRRNRPGRATLPGPLSLASKNPSGQSLGREKYPPKRPQPTFCSCLTLPPVRTGPTYVMQAVR
eukprot:4664358-Pyramimonas_sp.AAC.1